MVKIVRTRKTHFCHNCGEIIEKGEKAKTISRKFGRVDGVGHYWETFYYHMDCPIIEPYEDGYVI